MSKAVVSIERDYISISDEQGEIVYWDSDEWWEDPNVTVSIAVAIRLALTEGGDAVRAHIKELG